MSSNKTPEPNELDEAVFVESAECHDPEPLKTNSKDMGDPEELLHSIAEKNSNERGSTNKLKEAMEKVFNAQCVLEEAMSELAKQINQSGEKETADNVKKKSSKHHGDHQRLHASSSTRGSRNRSASHNASTGTSSSSSESEIELNVSGCEPKRVRYEKQPHQHRGCRAHSGTRDTTQGNSYGYSHIDALCGLCCADDYTLNNFIEFLRAVHSSEINCSKSGYCHRSLHGRSCYGESHRHGHRGHKHREPRHHQSKHPSRRPSSRDNRAKSSTAGRESSSFLSEFDLAARMDQLSLRMRDMGYQDFPGRHRLESSDENRQHSEPNLSRPNSQQERHENTLPDGREQPVSRAGFPEHLWW